MEVTLDQAKKFAKIAGHKGLVPFVKSPLGRHELPPSRIDRGVRYGRLTLIGICLMDKNRKRMLPAVCDCGNVAIVGWGEIRRGSTVSCGCKNRESIASVYFDHGLSGTRIYSIWKLMIRRCSKSGEYGKKGISVCEEWQNFLTFYDWAVSNGYDDNLTIDRIDGSDDYSPSNCRWADWGVQARNRQNNIWHTAFGETKCQQDWLSDPRCVTTFKTFKDRIQKGWSVERALTEPNHRTRSSKAFERRLNETNN